MSNGTNPERAPIADGLYVAATSALQGDGTFTAKFAKFCAAVEGDKNLVRVALRDYFSRVQTDMAIKQEPAEGTPHDDIQNRAASAGD
jgi:hypothetical protein